MKGKRKRQQRSGGDRRNFNYSCVAPERRSGNDRRLFDRRNMRGVKYKK